MHDQLGNPVANVDILNGHVAYVAGLVVLHDRFARREEPFGIRIALRRGQIADHVDQDFIRGIETEWGWVADVQFQDFIAFFFKTFSFFEHRATNVIADVVQFAGFLNGGHKKLSLLLGWGRSYRGMPQPAQCTPGAGAFEGPCTPLVQTKGVTQEPR
ncbi:hypothetical protein D3C72_1586510 [compost metagenome]